MPTSADLLAAAVRHHQAGQLREAEQLYRQILRGNPAHADALHLLGVIGCQMGHAAPAVDYIGRAIALAPRNPVYHSNLGNALQMLGRLDEAVAAYRRALELQPDFVDAHRNLGKTLQAQGRVDEAEKCYQQVLRLKPDHALAHNDLGMLYKNQGRRQEAVACYRQAVRCQPSLAEAHSNLGNVLKMLGQLEEAEVSCREALRWQPACAAAHNNLGNALADQGRIDQASVAYRDALRAQPDFPVAHSNLLLCLNYTDKVDPVEVFAEHRRFADICEGRNRPSVAHGNARDSERVLRIGYVSPDLRHHPLISFFEPVLRHHDPGKVHVTCYAEVAAPDAVTQRLQGLAHGWRSTCGLGDAQVADQIRRDQIDILVDLAGHTAGNRLRVFALRPAPVQVSYLGYPNTTGLRSIGYRLSDTIMDPPGTEALNSEELIHLSRGVCCYVGPSDAPPVAPLPAHARGHVTFGSLHKLSKLNAGVLDLWCRVLNAVPLSRLLVYRNTLTGKVADDLRRQFLERGIAVDRLDLRHERDGSHLAVYHDVDVALDTFPYAGGTTSCESLWMGVPFPTLRSDRPAGRAGAALVHAVGLQELIADSLDHYVDISVQLATDLDRLAEMRSSLRERTAATLGDAAAFTGDLEDVYRNLWRRWCSQSTASGSRS